MSLFRPAVLAIGLLTAAPSHAETTPQAVWDLVQREFGPALTATVSRRSDALILTRVRLQTPDDFAVLLPDLMLRQNQDGSVNVELPPRFPLVFDLPKGPRNPDQIVLNVAISDLTAVLRDIGPEDVDFSFSASAVSAVMDPIVPVEGQLMDDLAAVLAGADLRFDWQSRHRSNGEAMVKADYNLGTFTLDLRADIPSDNTRISAVADLSGLSAGVDLQVPAGVIAVMSRGGGTKAPNLPDFLELLEMGLSFAAKANSGPLSLSVEGQDPQNGPYALSLNAAGAKAEAGVNRGSMLYDVSLGSTDLDFKGNMPDTQVDAFSLGVAEVRQLLQVDLPSPQRDSPDWRLIYKIDGLAISDSIWDEGDPQRKIPRGPMSLVLDGTGTWTPDPRVMRGLSLRPGENPLSALSFDLAEARIAGSGVEMTGQGALAYDFADRSRYIDDVPVPEGKLSLLTIGANALIEKLAAGGVIPADELTGIRMGMMFLGKAVSGQTDHLTTEVEFGAGSIFLNGLKLR